MTSQECQRCRIVRRHMDSPDQNIRGQAPLGCDHSCSPLILISVRVVASATEPQSYAELRAVCQRWPAPRACRRRAKGRNLPPGVQRQYRAANDHGAARTDSGANRMLAGRVAEDDRNFRVKARSRSSLPQRRIPGRQRAWTGGRPAPRAAQGPADRSRSCAAECRARVTKSYVRKRLAPHASCLYSFRQSTIERYLLSMERNPSCPP